MNVGQAIGAVLLFCALIKYLGVEFALTRGESETEAYEEFVWFFAFLASGAMVLMVSSLF